MITLALNGAWYSTNNNINTKKVKCDAMNIVYVCRERERGGGYNGISIEIKTKFIYF